MGIYVSNDSRTPDDKRYCPKYHVDSSSQHCFFRSGLGQNVLLCFTNPSCIADGLALGLDSVSSTLAIWLAVDNEFHDLHTIKLAVW